MEPKKKSKKSIDQALAQVKEALKNYDVKFIDVMVDQTTAKEKERFKRYRIPMQKYIERLPKKRQYPIRLSPKKKPATPKKVSPKKVAPKKKNWTRLVDDKIDNMIEKISIVSDLAKTRSKEQKEATIEFLDSIKDQIKDFEKDMF